MSVLANKYRPKKLEDLIGQESVVNILKNSILSGKLHHAYIFAGKYGCGKCITGDSIVVTLKGLNRISSLVPKDAEKDNLITKIDLPILDETGIGISEYGYFEKNASTIRIETQEGFSIEGTPEHPVRILDKHGNFIWKKIDALSIGDKLAINRSDNILEFDAPVIKFDFCKNSYVSRKYASEFSKNRSVCQLDDLSIDVRVDQKIARFFGFAISEGYIGKYGFSLSNTDINIVNETIDVLNSFGISPSVMYDKRRDKVQKIVKINTASFREFCKYLQIDSPSNKKKIPDIVLGLPRSLMIEFLKSYFEGDGGVDGGRVSAYSMSRQLLSDIQTILLSLGIVSRLSFRRKKCSNCVKNKYFDSWQLSISGRDLIEFYHKIGFLSDRKNKKLKSIIDSNYNRSHKDIIPNINNRVNEIYDSLPISSNGRIIVNGSSILAPKWYGGVVFSRNQQLTYETIKKAINYFNKFISLVKEDKSHVNTVNICTRSIYELEKIISTNHYYASITTIEKGRFADVFDLCKGEFDHSFFANGIINHNTSAARIFAASVNDKKGMTLTPDLSDPDIQAIFDGKSTDIMEFDAGSKGRVDEIRELKETIRYAPMRCKYRFVILDECLSKDSRIDTDIGRIPIGVIVNNKLTPKVKSYNHHLNKIEYKSITGWFKNSGKEIFKVAFEGLGRVYASSGHLFATPNGYMPLKDLKVGDQVLRVGNGFSDIQKQVILGSLLGDMNIQRNSSVSQKWADDRGIRSCRARIKIVHGEKQFEYLDFKKALLESSLEFSRRDFVHSGFGGIAKPMRTYTSRTSSALSEIFNNVINTSCKKPRKTINRKWLDSINDLGLAIWFGDDGSVSKTKTKNGINPVVSLHTEGFTKLENQIICDWLKEKGYDAKVLTSSKNNLWHISMTTASSYNFLKNISPYLHSCLRYKISGIEGLSPFDSNLFVSSCEKDPVVTEVITSIKSLGYKDITYDLEIEGNHNYFASDTLVHNCHRLTGAAAEAALKMIEEPPENCIFILCTTNAEDLVETIHSRCLPLRFSKVPVDQLIVNLNRVVRAEGIEIDDAALKIAARLSKGSVRNSLQNLQIMMTIANGKKITSEIAQQALAAVDENKYFDLVDAILKPDAGEAMRIIDQLLGDGRDVGEVLNGLVGHIRTLIVIKTAKDTAKLLFLTDDEKKRFLHQSQSTSIGLLIQMIDSLAEVYKGVELNLPAQTMLEKFVICMIIFSRTENKAAG